MKPFGAGCGGRDKHCVYESKAPFGVDLGLCDMLVPVKPKAGGSNWTTGSSLNHIRKPQKEGLIAKSVAILGPFESLS